MHKDNDRKVQITAHRNTIIFKCKIETISIKIHVRYVRVLKDTPMQPGRVTYKEINEN